MKITNTTEIILNFKDIETYLREKNLVSDDQNLESIIKSGNEIKVRFHKANVPKQALKNFPDKMPEPKGNDGESIVCSPEQLEKLNTVMEDLDISVRLFNLLRPFNIHTLKDIVQLKPSQLKQIPGFGKKTMKELNEVLDERGLKLNMKLS